MPNTPLINTTVNITAKSLAGTSVAKQFNQVYAINCDYALGKLNIVDITGSFYFGLTEVTTFTVTIVGTATTVTIS